MNKKYFVLLLNFLKIKWIRKTFNVTYGATYLDCYLITWISVITILLTYLFFLSFNLSSNAKYVLRLLESWNLTRSSHQRCSIKISVLKNFPKFTGKHLCHSLFLNKVAGVFSCEFCEIFGNFFITEHLWTTASDYCLIQYSCQTFETFSNISPSSSIFL